MYLQERIEMKINYSLETKEICISVTKDELSDFAKRILEKETIIKVNSSDLKAFKPYDSFLQGIIIMHVDAALVIISITNDNYVSISGDSKMIEIFSENIKALSIHEKWGHIHVEHYPDHPYLSANSLPIVIEKIE